MAPVMANATNPNNYRHSNAIRDGSIFQNKHFEYINKVGLHFISNYSRAYTLVLNMLIERSGIEQHRALTSGSNRSLRSLGRAKARPLTKR
jgi:hypothetical protein